MENDVIKKERTAITENEFRIQHSKLMEYYQYIEMHLKGICSAMLSNNLLEWYQRINDYEFDTIKTMIKMIKDVQEEQHIAYLSPNDFAALDALRKARNYWTHECFGAKENQIVFTSKGLLKHPDHEARLKADFQTVTQWDEKLAEVYREASKHMIKILPPPQMPFDSRNTE